MLGAAPTPAALGPSTTVLLDLIGVDRRIHRALAVRLREVVAAAGNVFHAVHQLRNQFRRRVLGEREDRLRSASETKSRRRTAARGVPLSAAPQTANGLSGCTEILAQAARTASKALPELAHALSELSGGLADGAAWT